MKIIKTKFSDAVIIEPKVFGDHRGFFMESYNNELFSQHGIDMHFIQDNHSLSQQPGTLRGMHYQLSPTAQTKLIRVTRGAIYDVIIDIRKSSPTYGQWQGFILTADNKRQLLVPKGFAHGFCTLVENTEVQYKVDELYSSEHDRGIAWNDPHLNIDWPVHSPILSDKDTKHPILAEADNDFK
ncbi:dTDP-4-dehydrorhamnose 3,5-epimerase [Fictibacillus barbaricus]|uniref:dTDP-4-dehydrorhamnose 3,5-epimerase n=1 Tax=Fictibacillus barbaricus TaxID=182136 RepID=A0ABS2ZEB8_9BACL|nr:dTDP-4-dehydrorhamnose 3,5-epimerase [Fictibacillus barbaricus]MBN3546528.1 dTDP-4-dehydrorhamnose 3,5-epimerase [Fictibacillus barbaricus]GGB41736.1 dTDP-4-dehydrorhamnose 3,5-epimerase [Fictibacillus barbaricus]